jgi:hypothetical protein
VLVEVAGAVAGRMLPLDAAAAASLVDEVVQNNGKAGSRRGPGGWPAAPLADALLAMTELWRRHGAWLQSVDVNPLIVSDGGVFAVDALLTARTHGGSP